VSPAFASLTLAGRSRYDAVVIVRNSILSDAMANSKKQRASVATDGDLSPGENGRAAAPSPSNVDLPRIEKAVREILAAVGEDPDREGLIETPGRVARMYAEMFAGLHSEPREHLQKFFTEKYDEVVLVRDISFCSMCEHHLLPFIGKAHIGYLPAGKVVGLSKLARVVEAVARRPQVQERMTEQIADLLVDELGAKGVAVVIEASHSCMTIRGVRKPGSMCVTSAMKGLFRSNVSSRAEIMQLIYGDRT
jgi:GTP cyclohydrolase I